MALRKNEEKPEQGCRSSETSGPHYLWAEVGIRILTKIGFVNAIRGSSARMSRIPTSCIDQRLDEQARIAEFKPLLFGEWNLGQNGRFDYIFGFFGVFVRIDQLATGIHEARRHEDDQVPFDVLFRVRAEEATADWDITQKRSAVALSLLILL